MNLQRIFAVSVIFLTGLMAYGTPICPLTDNNSSGADASGCGVLATFSDTGVTITITGTGPYDGSEDATVGIINNSSKPLSSISLTADNGAFGFDGDGIQGYTVTNGVALGTKGATGYEGPTSTFDMSGVDSSGNGTLVVNFSTPIAANGGTDYFSLEDDPGTAGTGLGVSGGGTSTSATPEPVSLLLVGGGLAAIGGLRLRRRRD